MKKLNHIILTAALLLSLCGCSDWLDVNPRSQMKDSELFSSEEGFRSALNGVYAMMTQTNLYGHYTSVHIPEFLARNWTVPVSAESAINRLANFDYTDSRIEGLASTIWLCYYNVITQLNHIIENFENSRIEFSATGAALIEGEARGLRAFLHFELLRYFGPVPQGANMGAKAIPYMTRLGTDPSDAISISYADVLAAIEKDLNDAERILEAADPIMFNSNAALNVAVISEPDSAAEGNTDTPDQWLLWRQGRFNYYACLGAKARFYQWIGRNADATACARKVIEAFNADGTPKFTLATEDSYTGRSANLTMWSEQIFGLHIFALNESMLYMFGDATTSYTQNPTDLDVCYERNTSADDIRYKANRYWRQERQPGGNDVNFFRKFIGSGTITCNDRLPMLRLAEMYLIVIENLPTDEALPWFRTFRIARAMGVSTETGFASGGQTEKMSRLEKEYRKEFFGEGQMYFFYKRLDYKSYTWPADYTLPANAYVMPTPKAQQVFE